MVYRGVWKVNHRLRKVNHSLQKVNHSLRTVNHGLQQVNHGLTKANRGLQNVNHGLQEVRQYFGLDIRNFHILRGNLPLKIPASFLKYNENEKDFFNAKI
jgi:ABC-type transporter Mla subunit MlaD